MFLKFASADILDIKRTKEKVKDPSLSKFGKFEDYNDYKTDDGYLYVRVRAISSRVNKNHDGWPSEELKKSYKTFLGKPIFVDHHNTDPQRARGVVVDAELHVDDLEKVSSTDSYYANAPKNHLPPTWIELLLEVDAQQFPKLAKAIINNDIDGVSMGANVERTICSHCQNVAFSPDDYCKHILSKGAYFDYIDENGIKTSKKSYEDCFDISFFEVSFVFDPADETALKIDHKTARKRSIAKEVLAEAKIAQGGGTLEAEPEEEPEEEEEEGLQELLQPAVSDEEKARRWRIEELVRAGYSLDEAIELADIKTDAVLPTDYPRPIYRDLINLIERGATPEQAKRILTRRLAATAKYAYKRCLSCGAPYRFIVNDVCKKCGKSVGESEKYLPRPGGILIPEKESRDNPPPQSEMITMPENIDTLRQEQICPICGSDMDDGECQVCNYTMPPQGFDNPDLEKAKEVDQYLHQQVEDEAVEMALGNEVPLEVGEGPQAGIAPGSPSRAMPMASTNSTSNTPSATTVNGERYAQTQQGVRINQQERPILPASRKLTDKPKNQKTVKNPKEPVESKRNKEMTEINKTADGATPLGEGTQADNRVDLEEVGAVSGDPLAGVEHENVEKDTGDFVAPHTDTWTGEEGDSLPTADPVTSDTGDLQTVSKVGSEFPDHEPTRVDLEAGLAEEVGDRTTTDSTGTAFRSLEQADPVKGDSANQVGGPIGEAIAKAKAQVIAALKIAEMEVSLGLIEADSKFDRVAELENTPKEILDAQLEVLSKVKTAGLHRRRFASRQLQRMPSFRPVASFEINQHGVSDQEIRDAIGW